MTQVYSHCSNTKKVLGQRSHVTVIIMNDIHLAWPAPEPTRRIQTKHPHHSAWSGSK